MSSTAALMVEIPETESVVAEDSVRDGAYELWILRGCLASGIWWVEDGHIRTYDNSSVFR